MDDSSATSKKQLVLLITIIVLEAILAVADLIIFPENIKANCLAADGIAVAITAIASGFKKSWKALCACILIILGILAAIAWYALYPPLDEPESPPDNGSATSLPLPSDPDPDPDPGDTFTITEIDPTRDSIGFVGIDDMEKSLSDESDYFPFLEEMQDYRHLFYSFTEEFPTSNTVDFHEYQAYIIDHTEDWSVEKLKVFINQRFEESYQSVEDYPAQQANASTEIAENFTRIEELTNAIKQARATNELTLPLYEEYAELYLAVIDIAPRGEYYLQLARPYEEGILRMMRTVASDKNTMFLWAGNAVACFRTALTYKKPVGASVSDIFYRIAKVYHYIGDTPGLHPAVRSYFYRVSAAYMALAAEREAFSDTYYGYSTYYGAMVYHKLAIITDALDAKWNYLELAEQNYKKADEDYPLDRKAKDEIKHALLDIDTRKRQGY